MARQKITDEQLKSELEKNKTGAEIARKYKMSEAAVSIRIKRLREVGISSFSKPLNPKQQILATRVEGNTLDASRQLYKINTIVNRLLNEVTGDEKLIQDLLDTAAKLDFYEGAPDKQKAIVEQLIHQITDDRNFAIRACAEIRDQLRLQLDIFKTLYSMQAIQDFQRIVLDTINSVDPTVRDRIITALHRQRLLR